MRMPFPIHTNRNLSPPEQLGNSIDRTERNKVSCEVQSVRYSMPKALFGGLGSSHVPLGQTESRAPLTSPTVSAGLHSIVTARPSRFAKMNRSVTLLGSYV